MQWKNEFHINFTLETGRVAKSPQTHNITWHDPKKFTITKYPEKQVHESCWIDELTLPY